MNSVAYCILTAYNIASVEFAKSHHAHRFLHLVSINGCVFAGTRVIIKVSGHQHWWLAGGYDLEVGHL